MRIISRRVEYLVDAMAAFETCFADGDHPWLLDSALAGAQARFSYLGSADGPLARVLRVHHGPGVELREHGATRRLDRDLLDVLVDDLVGDVPVDGPPPPPGFRLGWVGYLGYEYAMRLLTGLDVPDETPEAVLVFTDRAVVIDAVAGGAWILALTDAAHEAEQQAWVTETAAVLAHATRSRSCVANCPAQERVPVATADVTVRHPYRRYLDLVEQCRAHIAAGDSYELCLTNRITVSARTDPWQLYRRLRDSSPRPFGAYLAFDGGRVLSASPERFLSIGIDGTVEAKPIKGTRPRGVDAEDDRRLAEELAGDEKELAENLMIVDLLRNDLNRVCRPGSVHVPKLFDVETYPGVHQLVSTVRGRLRPGLTAVDAVRAALPGGSMTGAPKHRSVQLLRELEDGPRGVYSGVIGYFSLDGSADWSIAIRTVVWHPDHLSYGTGGAVTADSTPRGEWDETVVKARTLGTALGIDLDAVLPTAPATQPALWPGSYTRRDQRWVPLDDPDGELLLADSWRRADGHTHRLDLHRERFLTSAAEIPDAPEDLDGFFDAAAGAVPASGEWFPRVRLLRTPDRIRAVFDLRPGPPRQDTVVVEVLPPGDPRSNPSVKGPDLDLAGELIARARIRGADEILLRTENGTVLEAGWSSVVWWDGDTLVLPSSDLPVLPGITRHRLVDLARVEGVRVREVHAGIEELDGRETWLLNAYQGLRLVTGWLGAEITPGAGERFAHWRALLNT
ncbi:aminodeoxychorismate synthase component I [Enemella sp. A6]|uniref:aminodeoxychorismate synthase component I n=1 Tax=Enemella sp. A6 TaxID=3440152 RepID=UPI003EB8DFCE